MVLQESTEAAGSATWLRAVFEQAALGIALVGIDGLPVRVNPALERLSGYPAAELCAMSLDRLTHPDDLPRDRDLLRQLLRGERAEYQVENRYLRKDGVVVWGRLTVSLLHDEETDTTYALALVEDITERKHAEAALERSESRFRSLIENASDLVTVLAADGTIQYESPSVERMLGYQPEELVGRSVFDLVHPEDRERTGDTFRRVLENPGVILSYELRYLHRDGSYRWLEGVGSNLLHDPAVVGIVANSRDITPRKAAEQALEREHVLFERLFESSPEGVALVDPSDRILRINREFTRIFGYSEAEAVGRTVRELLVPDERKEEALAITQRIAAGDRVQVETTRRRKDGSRVEVAVLGVPIRIADDRPAVYGIYQDISERKAAEAALRESENRFRTLVEVLGEGIMITDLEERILYTNRRNCEITGYAAEELIGQVSSELLLPPEERERMRSTQQRYGEGHANRYELRQFRKDGSTVWVEVSRSPLLDASGDVIGTVGAIADITERKEMEQALRRMSTTDVLTGLLNRRGFLELAEREWALAVRRNQELLLLYMDLDGFKRINDSHGHGEGDRLLQDVAELLRQSFRSTDVIARLGGDEFVILAVDAACDTEAALMERVHQAVQGFNRRSGRPYSLAISVGARRAAAGGASSLDELLADADRRMYERKWAQKERASLSLRGLSRD